jgi:hypothetical protein
MSSFKAIPYEREDKNPESICDWANDISRDDGLMLVSYLEEHETGIFLDIEHLGDTLIFLNDSFEQEVESIMRSRIKVDPND